MQSLVERALEKLLGSEVGFGYAEVKTLLDPEPASVPFINIGQPNLGAYDELLMAAGGCA